MKETGNINDNIIPEGGMNSENNEEGSRICPLCSSKVRFFFMNENEKILMCENVDTCEFPFGDEDLQFEKLDGGEELNDFGSSESGSLTQEQSSSSEYDSVKPCRVFDTETKKTKRVNQRIASEQQSEKLMKKNLKDLKGLTMELKDMSTNRKTINNKKWIKNLMHLQDQSGFKLLKQEELKKVNKADDASPELKIDIKPGSSGGVSLIKIAIAEQEQGADSGADSGHVVT